MWTDCRLWTKLFVGHMTHSWRLLYVQSETVPLLQVGRDVRQRYSSTHSYTPTLERQDGERQDVYPLYPRKVTWYLLYRRLGRPRGRRTSPPREFEPEALQPVMNRYPGPLDYCSVSCYLVVILLGAKQTSYETLFG